MSKGGALHKTVTLAENGYVDRRIDAASTSKELKSVGSFGKRGLYGGICILLGEKTQH